MFLDSSQHSPSVTVCNLGVTMDCPFLPTVLNSLIPATPALQCQEDPISLLIEMLLFLRLDNCNSVLAGLPLCAIQPVQGIQYAAV